MQIFIQADPESTTVSCERKTTAYFIQRIHFRQNQITRTTQQEGLKNLQYKWTQQKSLSGKHNFQLHISNAVALFFFFFFDLQIVIVERPCLSGVQE